MLLEPSEAAQALNVDEKTVVRWIKKDNLPAESLHGDYRINPVDLLEWATERGIKVNPALYKMHDADDRPLPTLSQALQAGGIHCGFPGNDKETVLRNAVAILDLPPEIDWAGIFQSLPRNEAGAVAWMKALDEKLIAPKPGIAPDAKDEDPTDSDVELMSSGQAEYKVIFQHKPHTQWMSCPACHAGVFEMEKGKAKMTMADMGDGKQCGACHGKVAAPEYEGSHV